MNPLPSDFAALDLVPNSVVITDPEGAIQWVNSAFCRVTGYSREEVIGQNPRVLKSGHQSAAFYAGMWSTIKAGRAWQGEMVNRRKDGTHYVEGVTITPVKNAGGDITHFIALTSSRS